MKRLLWVLLAAGLSLAPAQTEGSKAVPVTVLGFELSVVWPAPTLQLFGPDCDAASQTNFQLARKLDPRVPEAVERYACYRLMVGGADKQATTVNFIAGYTRQGAGYTLTFEQSDAEGRLVQVWEKQDAPALVYVFSFLEDRIDLTVGQVPLAASSGS
ncbi:MAG TPA: hypothetical protein ENK37_01115 [Oceanithermus profundus]|uniref:Uncharacterized protein n=1 Tax=Oceanithermus profundus TaxID=187137 RepID=A0A7C4VB53_9DEIN|nr:hypothetical protein [Oceanithermus profundus]